MIQFKVSVPINLSLFGEHDVRQRKAGLMGSIDLRTTLTFEEISNSTSFLHINFSHIYRTLDVPFEKFLEFYNHCVQDIESLNKEVQKLVNKLYYQSPSHKEILQALFYLFIYIAYKEQIEIKAFRMLLSTEFLVDNEFACSASITICLVVCFLNWSRLQKGVTDTFDDANIKSIQLYATHYEEISSQSGIVDVFTCLYGSLTQYQDGHITRFLEGMPSMTILLVDSKAQKPYLSARKQQVTKLMDMIPQLADSLFKSIDALTQIVFHVFHNLISISKNKNLDPVSRLSRTSMQIKLLETCTRINRSLLECLNVNHRHVINIYVIAQKYGMCGKCAGNGRFVYIWCPEHIDEPCTHMKLLTDELTTQDFHVTETKFAHEGMKIEP